MRSSRWIAVTAVGVLAAVAVIVTLLRARPNAAPHPITPAVTHSEVAHGDIAADTAPQRDPEALDALERMGDYLRTLKSFQLRADVVTEDVRTDGQKVQIIRAVDLIARRPNRLFAEINSDRQRRLFFYDGSHFTLYAPRPSFYATIDAPPTIEQLADRLEDQYDLELPFVDLFRWGTPEGNVNAITSAVDLGPSAINGITCEQYAFRQEGIDWQLWMQQGEQPLPCRLVITTTTDDARPQHTATYSWNLAPSYDDILFVFSTPSGAKPIPLAQVQPAVAMTQATP